MTTIPYNLVTVEQRNASRVAVAVFALVVHTVGAAEFTAFELRYG
jgi:hypothetical protein